MAFKCDLVGTSEIYSSLIGAIERWAAARPCKVLVTDVMADDFIRNLVTIRVSPCGPDGNVLASPDGRRMGRLIRNIDPGDVPGAIARLTREWDDPSTVALPCP